MVHIQALLMDAQILNVVQDFVVRTQNMTFEKKIRDRKVISNPVNIIHDDFDDASKVDFLIRQIVSCISEPIFDI